MLLNTRKYVAVLACAGLILAVLPAFAGDKDKPALTGAWVQQGAELRITFVDKDTMKIYPHGENEVLVIVCSYSVAKDGLVKAKITDLEGKEEAKEKAKELVPIGLEFTFAWKVKDDTATLAGVKGDKVQALKAHLEGKYEPKR
jgi:hypothetical protein